ncbi:ErmE/ErmH/ErmO/ErmR family 23S rRNA (adenine(2058)-N(6))-methyltransferase [Plantactinospora sp. KLBMP9567]|uniref:ErmE/ErmH/ErmO/ErmR family 23S rRNA (adenine(2058)-N(6))-methyltransferase n=1 Tax=Plantactinospora sp. KLBMP9567 TaxID=3085900 RepID=UPI002980CF6F|nr:ErmE/ErmH/ErmO/ErmR family 23S rRNA (adenine(2058)-N(6))-methyltransferase [Plantactinospora sp. KLBMP9567]MDW5330210.1 ErmE/ErmH/ErmO/ErmR family 23S rRNA (adenine(2058)-N(6))-methyltransferase [Plantactinospora sp. KLBMP9567]
MPRTGPDRSRRVLGQNFLRDDRTIAQIIASARPDPAGLILEVGAGQGALTRELVRRCRRVVAYEIDPALVAGLGEEFRSEPGLRLVHADFVAARPPTEPFAVVGNIPYASTSRIVDWCLDAPGLTTATLVTQLEYARKRCGDYGRWTLRTVQTWPWMNWRLAGRIPRERFRPMPRVDSGILRLERRAVELLPAHQLADYERFVALGFSGVGGSLRASLHRGYPARRVDAALRANRVPADILVGYVWPEQWISLFQAVHPARR